MRGELLRVSTYGEALAEVEEAWGAFLDYVTENMKHGYREAKMGRLEMKTGELGETGERTMRLSTM